MHISFRGCIVPFKTGSGTVVGPEMIEVSRHGTGSFRGELRQTLRGQYLTSCGHRHGTCPGHSGGRVWEIGGLGCGTVVGTRWAQKPLTLRQTNIAMENGPFEDVFPIENGDIPLLC